MGSLSSPVVTSYRLPIVTIGLSLTVFAVLGTDTANWSSKRRHYALLCICCQKFKPDMNDLSIQVVECTVHRTACMTII